MRMKADGYYDWHSPVQAATNAVTIPLVTQATAALLAPCSRRTCYSGWLRFFER